MTEQDKLNETVYLTFKTTKETNEILNQIAEIKGKKQPQLLDEMCQKYIQKTLVDLLLYCEEKGFDATSFFLIQDP